MSALPFVTAEELAVVLRAPRYTILAWARRIGPDALPSYRAGKRVVFLEGEAVEWFVRTQRRTATPPVPRRRLRRQRRGAGLKSAGAPGTRDPNGWTDVPDSGEADA